MTKILPELPYSFGTVVFVGLGSNMGGRIHHLSEGIHALEQVALDGQVQCSPVYETEPVGFLDQGPFLNLVAGLSVKMSAHEFLQTLLEIEAVTGRIRTIKNGPRTLDLDLLLYGQSEIADEVLQVPHPRMHSRGFVLAPLSDLAPHLVLPDGRIVKDAARYELARTGGIRYVGRFW